MSTSENRMPLSKAKAIADRFIKYLEPYCSVISVAGSIRRECETCGDVEIIALPKDKFSMSVAFPFGFKGLTINGERLKRFIYPESGIQIELYLPQPHDYGRILAIRTGNAAYARLQLMTQANRSGWIGTSDGLRLKRECDHKGSTWRIKPEYKSCPTLPPIFATEEQFFAFIGLDYVHPTARNWVSNKAEYNYSK
jgi:DNA polymerase/3'-5' exonuclease PolX